VAYLVEKYKADAGVMISASHNSYEYNGIKIFSGDGYKLPDDLEERIESIILGEVALPPQAADLSRTWRIGVTAGASCPANVIESVVRRLAELRGCQL
jgi:phosphomannomutase